jgi:hypothetical protein
MSKEVVVLTIQEIGKALEKLDADFDGCNIKLISKKQTQHSIQSVAKKWFEDIETILEQFSIS